MPLFAVHISDGVLTPPFWLAGLALATLLLVPAGWRIREDEVPRIGLLTAAFFVASSIHVKVPPASVHLLLNALVGVVLGRRATLAIAVGLFLQAALLAHGGFTTLGVNTVVIGVPALLAGPAFRFLAGRRGLAGPRRAFWAGAVVGFFTVVLTAFLNAVVLIAGGIVNWVVIAAPQFAIYLVLAGIEGVILGMAAEFLARVKPELLNLRVEKKAGAATAPADVGQSDSPECPLGPRV